MSSIDHNSLAISRLATQFKESTNLINYIRALLVEANNLEEVFCDNQLDQYSAKEWLRDAFDEGKKYGRALGIQQMKRDSGWE